MAGYYPLFPHFKNFGDGTNMGYGDYSRKDLTGYDLRRGSFRDFVFANSILKYASFEGADLTGASFLSADLEEVNFKNAKLEGALFIGANLSGANFAGATGRMRGGDYTSDQWVQRVGPTIADLHLFVPGADLRNANLRGAELANLDLSGANLSDADLTNAKFTDCNCMGTIFRRALFGRTRLIGDFRRADFRGASFNEAYAHWNINGATARGASFYNCTISSLAGDVLDPSTDLSHIFRQGNLRYCSGITLRGAQSSMQRTNDGVNPDNRVTW